MKFTISALIIPLGLFFLPLPGKQERPPPEASLRDTTIKILSYNVWALPVGLPGLDKKGRYPDIPDSILSMDADIVCLQEAFDKRMREQVASRLGEHYEMHEDYLQHRKIFGIIHMDRFGGLMTFSKYPFLWEKFYPHEVDKNMKPAERKGLKGFMFSTIETEMGRFNIINIHLYSGRKERDENQRLKQLRYLRQKMEEDNIFQYPTIITGDFNMVHPSVAKTEGDFPPSEAYQFVVDSIGLIDCSPSVAKDEYTYNYLENRYADKNERSQKLDYCFFYPSSNCDISVKYHRVVFKEGKQLSDHFGILTLLEISRN